MPSSKINTHKAGAAVCWSSAWKSLKGASKALDNLTAPTAVNVDLLPATDNSINIGSATKQWKDLHLYNLVFSDGSIQSTAASGGGVNSALSNLTAATAVNVDLLPGTDNAINFGSTTNQWKDIYTGGSLFIGGYKIIDGSGVLLGNTFIGYTSNTTNTGSFNSFLGVAAGTSNTTGSKNSFLGFASGVYNTDGTDNTYTGQFSGFINTSGSFNSIYGSNAGFYNSASNNCFFGNNSGPLKTSTSHRNRQRFSILKSESKGA